MKTIKNKISMGVIFLFVIILLLSILGIIFINKLAEKSKGSIVDNYSSVDYLMNMLNSLDYMNTSHHKALIRNSSDSTELRLYIEQKNIFEKNLLLETKNITEKGENELVNHLHLAYRDYLESHSPLINNQLKTRQSLEQSDAKYTSVRNKIFEIYKLNMQAIFSKNNAVQVTADKIIFYTLIVVSVSILITLSFIFIFPARIVEPIKELTKKIKFISERNYDQKLQVNTHDELGELAYAFNTMAERLKLFEDKQIDQILFEQKRMEAVVQSIEDGILFIDENRVIVIINNTILQITGLRESEILYKDIKEVADRNDLVREIYRSVFEKNTNGNSDIKPLRIVQEGKELFYNLEIEKIISFKKSENKEAFIGNLLLLRNITQYQERDKAKTNLLATVSHELKTPLSSLNLSLKLLEDKRMGDLNSEQKEVVHSLKQQSSRLSRVINELLDYSQIETGNIKLTMLPVKPDLVLDLGITALTIQLSEKNIELKTNIEEELPRIKIDLEKLAFVFINLLNNAIRYSKNGDEIQVDVRKHGNEVVFSIRDKGPGISEKDIEKLFQRFTQVGDKYKKGWGLGLAISKEFVQAQGGKIWVESEPGKGSIFFFAIPGV